MTIIAGGANVSLAKAPKGNIIISGGGGGGGASTVWAKNQLGSQYVVTEGDKVWLSPISSENEQIYKWDSNSSYTSWKRISLCSYSGVDTYLRLCVQPRNGGTTSTTYDFGQLLTDVPTTGNVEVISGNYVPHDSYQSMYCVYHATPLLDHLIVNASNSSWSFSTYSQTKTGCYLATYKYLNNGFGFSWSSSTHITTIVRMADDGTVGETVGTSYNSSIQDIMYPIYIFPDGQTVIGVNWNDQGGVWQFKLNSNGKYVYDTQLTLNDGLTRSNIFLDVSMLGATSDGKYLVGVPYGYWVGGSYHIRILKFDNNYTSISLYTGLGVNDSYSCNFYPYSDTLVAWLPSDGIIRMWKYDSTNGFVEKTLDFGGVTFPSILITQGVTLNYDCSMMCVNTGDNGVYLFSLQAASPNTYKAIPFNRTNFNSTSFTGILTGNTQDDNVEVKAVMD